MNATNTPTELLTRFRVDREPTILEIADSEKYATWSTVVRAEDPNGAVKLEQHPDRTEMSWRFAGRISVLESRRQFRIALYPGATTWDLAHLEREVDKVKSGYFNQIPFRSHTEGHHGTVWQLFPGYVVLNTRQLGDEYASFIVKCDDVACESTWHETRNPDDIDDVMHEISVSKDVSLQRMGTEDWAVSIDTYGMDVCSPEQATSLANDLQWASAEARKLNAGRSSTR